MKQATALFALTALSFLGAWCQDKPQSTPPAKPIDDLAWLIGGVWTADASKMGGGIERIETRYEWSDNHTFLRFNTHFVTNKATLHRYDGQFFWDSQDAVLKMWYMDAHNDITQGLITVHGDVFDFDFRGTNFAGQPADLKVQLFRKNNDRYVWQLSEKGTQGWQQLLSLEYIRSL